MHSHTIFFITACDHRDAENATSIAGFKECLGKSWSRKRHPGELLKLEGSRAPSARTQHSALLLGSCTERALLRGQRLDVGLLGPMKLLLSECFGYENTKREKLGEKELCFWEITFYSGYKLGTG